LLVEVVAEHGEVAEEEPEVIEQMRLAKHLEELMRHTKLQ
jgi:hypothetical protein